MMENTAMDDSERYAAAARAMRTGVELEQRHNDQPTRPTVLRAAANAAFVDGDALVRLLIAKGVFTLDEYTKAQADAMVREVVRYEQRLSNLVDGIVKLR
jgi:hypothetical protein